MKLDDYIVLDIESPNTKSDSICSIAFIQVKKGKVTKEEYSLINPECSFSNINIRINKRFIFLFPFTSTNKNFF